MSFSPAFLEEIRNRLPLSDIIGKRIRLTRAGREYKACCPFHNEKSASFYINDDKQFFHCFGCGAHGDVIGFCMRYDRLSFPEAIEALAAQAGLPLPQDTPIERERFDHEKRLYQLLERATVWFEEQLFGSLGRDALGYLRKRGLNDEAIRRFRLGYAPAEGQALIRKMLAEEYKVDELVSVGLAKKSDTRDELYSFFRNRVLFPVGDSRGRTVAFGGRVLAEGEPKYLNSPDHALFHKGKLLYGLSRARAAVGQGQPLIVVEGYMDVIALVEAGFSGAVAPLGTALTETQLALLWKLLPPVEVREPQRDYNPVLCFDGDTAGLRAAARALERTLPLLTPSQSLRVAFMPNGEDPDELIKKAGRAAMDEVLQAAKPMIDVLWDMTLAGRSLRTPEERAAFTTIIKQRVSRIAHEGLRHLYQDEIKSRLGTLFQPLPSQNYPSRREGPHGFRGERKENWREKASSLSVPPALVRRQPTDNHQLRERAFLAVMINHPPLFNEFGEDFACLEFSNPSYEALRQRVVEILSIDSQEPLDVNALYRHLSTGEGVGSASAPGLATLAEILSEATYLHAGFARPERSLEQARHGWKSMWNKRLQEQLEHDLQSARRRYAENSSEENLSRLMTLRGQVETLIRDLDDGNVSESA